MDAASINILASIMDWAKKVYIGMLLIPVEPLGALKSEYPFGVCNTSVMVM